VTEQPSEGSRPDQVAQAWDAFWSRTTREQNVVDLFATRGFLPAGPRLTARVAREVLAKVGGRRILDAGCGSGLPSLSLARRGFDVTLLDISPSAVESVRRRSKGLGVDVILGSIFEMPFDDEAYDLVWNTGVLEHFDDEGRRGAINEMLRVTRPGGAVLTVNPYAGSKFYCRMHDYAVRRGTWDVGHEEPFESMRPYVGSSTQLEEFPIAMIGQLQYAKYALPRWARLPYIASLELVELVAQPLDRRRGSLLVSVIAKP
jgi:SAM-dependent methyltransferase